MTEPSGPFANPQQRQGAFDFAAAAKNLGNGGGAVQYGPSAYTGGNSAERSLLAYLGPMRQRQVAVPRGENGGPGGVYYTKKDHAKSVDEVTSLWYTWDEARRRKWAEAGYKAGLLKSPIPDQDAQALWAQAVLESGQRYSASKGTQKYTPEDIVNIWGNVAHGGIQPKTTTQTSYNIPTKAEAAANARQVWQQKLGRDPTSAELRVITGLLTGAARKSPSVTKNTVDAQGNQTSTTTGGFGADDAGELLSARAQADPEFGAYQGATYYFNALQGALAAPA